VLVYGATGAIGSAAVQILKSLGANVTAVCATPHLVLVSGLGADKVVDYTAQDFTKDDQRYDGRVRCRLQEHVRAMQAAAEAWRAVPRHGRGPRCGRTYRWRSSTALLGGKRVVLPALRRSQATVKRVRELLESGKFQAGHRPAVLTGPDHRGSPLRRDGAEGRRKS